MNNSELIISYFKNIYFILEQHLLNSNTITKAKKQKLYYLKKSYFDYLYAYIIILTTNILIIKIKLN